MCNEPSLHLKLVQDMLPTLFLCCPERVMDFEKELTAESLSEGPWLVLYHRIPQDANEQLLKAARSAAVVCRVETEDLMTHGINDPHASDLKKIETILTDIRTRLGEPEPCLNSASSPKPTGGRHRPGTRQSLYNDRANHRSLTKCDSII